jgi:hypothetical protein
MRPLPRRTQPKRQGLIRRPVRTRMEASVELARLEYERDKLIRQLTELREKFDAVEGELSKVADRAVWLQNFLAEQTTARQPVPPQTVAVTVHVPVPQPKMSHGKSAQPKRRGVKA